MNNKIKVRLEDGTIDKVSKFLVDDKEFDRELEAIDFLKDKLLQDIRLWFEDNSCVSKVDDLINDFKSIKSSTLAELVVLLSDLL